MSNVVSLFEVKVKKSKESETKDESQMDFEAIEARNKRNKERIERERQNANKSVCRSHRLTKNDPNNKRK